MSSVVDSREEKEITLQGKKGEQKFILKQYNAFKGLAYQRKLVKILQPSFTAMIEASNTKEAKDKPEGVGLEAIALQKFMENIDQVEPAFLKELVVEGAWKEGRVTINFENDFAGNYGVLFSLIAELIIFNFSDLFQLLGLGQTA
jgi:hypothetical protein